MDTRLDYVLEADSDRLGLAGVNRKAWVRGILLVVGSLGATNARIVAVDARGVDPGDTTLLNEAY